MLADSTTKNAVQKANSDNWRPEFSTAGFYCVDNSPRNALNFNVGWRFLKGTVLGAEASDFDDSDWSLVNTPHGLDLLPLETSGSVNYQGEAWYRKRFHVDEDLNGKKIALHFEAIMGKSRIWVNGKLLRSHFGGFLPCIVDLTSVVEYGKDNIVVVCADNSDDETYPPGKSQEHLDYVYFGGIYRDVWMVVTNMIHITDPNAVDKVAGGGVFVHFDAVSDSLAEIGISVHVANETILSESVEVGMVLVSSCGKIVARSEGSMAIAKGGSKTLTQTLSVESPRLWHVDDPQLHDLVITLRNSRCETVDALRLRIGIRSVEFKGRDGFYLNGKPFVGKLIGGNRHQDYAYVGNAVSNTTHWRDAKKMRDAAMRVVRCAHYPQDPAFMDACDELGLLVIINTPGWQFWSDDPRFADFVEKDIRNMVRRDRNRPSAFLWEPILNETRYPAEFAKRVHYTVHEEFPFSGCYTACDTQALGEEHFDVRFAHPFKSDIFLKEYLLDTPNIRTQMEISFDDDPRCVFTREWGDSVDSWSAHNSPSRVAKGWGEQGQLIQLKHYANPDYIYTCWESLFRAPLQHIGGTLWHSFDHQRGYHPDPFWGGIFDAYRQPKYSYYMFKSQISPDIKIPNVDSAPFVYIAHEMTPFSGADVTVLSNCDEVSFRAYGKNAETLKTKPDGCHMPHQPVVFKDVFNFMESKQLVRSGKIDQVTLEAEGLIDGVVVAKTVCRPAMRRHAIRLKADFSGAPLVADGSDFVPIIAQMVDANGTVKRLTEEYVQFTVEGAGELMDNGNIQANPQKMQWGEAVVLVRAGTKPGKIRIYAEVLLDGINTPLSEVLLIETVAASQSLLYSEIGYLEDKHATANDKVELSVCELQMKLKEVTAELNSLKLRTVEIQQAEFE